ncbi:MAG: glycosyltransferase family 4 protein [Balneola sp.]|nr:MAG: glycosyltransferase family 4 protein [Balneola sp.]
MKVALVHDVLFGKGGAERVFLDFCEAYPNADIFTSVYLPEKTYPEFKKYRIRTSFVDRFIRSERLFKLFFFPFVILSMSRINLKDYDLILVSTTHCAKYPKMSDNSVKIFYCYTPFRLAWRPDSYSMGMSNYFINKLKFFIVQILKRIDFAHAQKANMFIAMTKETRERIRKAYKFDKEIPILEPSINIGKFSVSETEGNYYLLVSRFEPYKKVDLAINAFNKSRKKLIIVGNGTQKEYLKSIANSNIEFKEGVSDRELIELYSNCKAFIFPQYEDYGLTPIEANASGKPVICFRAGGALDTMVDKEVNPDEGSAVFFDQQTPDSLNQAVKKLESLKFDPKALKNNALRFDRVHFIERLKLIISDKLNEIQN